MFVILKLYVRTLIKSRAFVSSLTDVGNARDVSNTFVDQETISDRDVLYVPWLKWSYRTPPTMKNYSIILANSAIIDIIFRECLAFPVINLLYLPSYRKNIQFSKTPYTCYWSSRFLNILHQHTRYSSNETYISNLDSISCTLARSSINAPKHDKLFQIMHVSFFECIHTIWSNWFYS